MRYPLIGGPMDGISWEVDDTAHDLVYAPGPLERMPDGKSGKRVFIHQPAAAVRADDPSIPRYVFDPTAGRYVWKGALPERQVHRGVTVERFE